MSHNKQLPIVFIKTRSVTFWIIILSVILIVAAGSYYFSQTPPENESKGEVKGDKRKSRNEKGSTPVSVETVTASDFPVYLNGLGTVTALRTVTVKPRVDGELIKVNFTEGQVVKQGELLAEIDPRTFDIQLQQVEGQLLRDEALLKNAQLDQQRYQKLLEQDSIAAQQTMTQAALVKQYEGVVVMDKAQVNNAKLQVSYAHLTAPISGKVGLRLIDQGNIVHASDSNGLVVITQLQPITVIFTLAEDKVQSIIKRLHSNQAITITALDRAGKNALAEGKLLAIDNQIDSSTGTLKLKAQFDNTDNSLFANQFVNIRMHLETLNNAIQIPSSALQQDNQGAFVYIAKADNTVEVRRIKTGPTEADKIVVESNLNTNEKVVTEGFDRLQAGSRIDITEIDNQPVAASVNTEANKDAKASKRKTH